MGGKAVTLKPRLGRWLFAHMPITRLFDQLRVGGQCVPGAVGQCSAPWRRRRLALIRLGRELRVNVACGPQDLPGFVNLHLFPGRRNVVEWDCGRGLRVANRSAPGIRADHFVEHLEPREELLPAFL
jgi:hypothetical protein